MFRIQRLWPVLFVVCLGIGCAGGGEGTPAQGPETPTGPVLTDPVLGIQLVQLPEGWSLAETPQAAQFGLKRVAPETGEIAVGLGAAEIGTNLVDAVSAHQAEIEARPNGAYQGARELGGPLGRAYYSRGRYETSAGATEEETSIFTLKPSIDGIIVLRYRYPAGEDSAERIQSLFDVFANIEAAPLELSEESSQAE